MLQKHHIFFNEAGYHNHITHQLLTLFGLGAPIEAIENRYKENASYQRPNFAVEERILEDMAAPANFKKYLGKEKYYHDFLVFFQNEMEKKGWEKVLNEYLFAEDERADDMLGRMFAGRFSPSTKYMTIHTSRFPPPNYSSRFRHRISTTCHHRRISRSSGSA